MKNKLSILQRLSNLVFKTQYLSIQIAGIKCFVCKVLYDKSLDAYFILMKNYQTKNDEESFSYLIPYKLKPLGFFKVPFGNLCYDYWIPLTSKLKELYYKNDEDYTFLENIVIDGFSKYMKKSDIGNVCNVHRSLKSIHKDHHFFIHNEVRYMNAIFTRWIGGEIGNYEDDFIITKKSKILKLINKS